MKVEIRSVRDKVWPEVAALFCVFMQTYMLYPGIVFQNQGDLVAGKPDWSLFLLSSIMGITEFTGRSLSLLKNPYRRVTILTATGLRLVLIASTFLIAFQVWDLDALAIINTALIGLTNGLLATGICSTIPGMLEPHEREFSGFLMSVTINASITVGSLISLLGFSRLF